MWFPNRSDTNKLEIERRAIFYQCSESIGADNCEAEPTIVAQRFAEQNVGFLMTWFKWSRLRI